MGDARENKDGSAENEMCVCGAGMWLDDQAIVEDLKLPQHDGRVSGESAANDNQLTLTGPG